MVVKLVKFLENAEKELESYLEREKERKSKDARNG